MERGDRIRQRAIIQKRSRRGAMDAQERDMGQFREDVGIRMTKAGYKKYTEGEADYKKNYDEYKGKLQAADSKLNKATQRANSMSLDKLWNTASKNFVTVHVVNKDNIETSYKMPKEAVDAMNKDTFNQGDGSYIGNYNKDGSYNIDVVPRGTSDAYGKELHQMMKQAGVDIRNKFDEETAPILTKAQKEALGILKGERDIVAGYWQELNESKRLRDDQKADAKADYAERKVARGTALAGAV